MLKQAYKLTCTDAAVVTSYAKMYANILNDFPHISKLAMAPVHQGKANKLLLNFSVKKKRERKSVKFCMARKSI